MSNPEILSYEGEVGFRAMFQFATVGILVINRDGIIEVANPYIERSFGYNAAELVGRPVELLIPHALRRTHIGHRHEYFNNPNNRPMGHGMELHAQAKDGREFPVEISLGHYELYGRQLAVAFITDITQRKLAEMHARATEKEYRFIFDGIHESFMLQGIIRDQEDKIVDLLFLDINPATERIIGRTRQEIIGHRRSEFFGGLDTDLITVLDRVEKGEPVTYHQYIRPLDRWFERRFYMHKPGQFISFNIDITKEKKNEALLRQSRMVIELEKAALSFINASGSRLARTYDMQEGLDQMLTDSIQLTGADKGNVQIFDPRTQSLLILAQHGFNDEFLQYFAEVSASDTSACGRAFQDKTQITIEDTETDITYRDHRDIARRAGYRAVQSTPLYARSGEPIGMISTHYQRPHRFEQDDQRKMALLARMAESFVERCQLVANLEMTVEQRTTELAEALEREKGLSELKSRFMSIASHEFRTPLTTILSSTSLLDAYQKDDQANLRKKHTGRIKAAVKYLIDVLNDFLSLDKLEQGKVDIVRQPIDLARLIDDIVDNHGVNLRNGQQVHVSFDAPVTIGLDQKAFTSILLNLLSNASKYSGENTHVHVAVRSADGQVIISVRDEGIGIPAADQVNLFGTFYRASNVSGIQGTGLGLNIVKRYIELLGGAITFESEIGQGTTFIVSLPLQ